MLVVVKNGDVGAAIRKLKKKTFLEGIVKEVMQRRYYEKPSVKRRRKKAEASRRCRVDQKRKADEYGIPYNLR